jgi:signal transduction histidine kinase
MLEEKLEELARMNRELESAIEQRTAELRDAVRSERELRRHLLHQEKLASIGQLAAGLAHEINNPLAFVQSNLTQLRDGLAEARPLDPSEAQEILEETLEGVNRIRRVTGGLRGFSRRDGGEARPTDLAAVVEGALRMTRGEIESRAVLTVEAAPDLPPVTCHAWAIEQVIVNLLMNAAQAVERGGRIRVSLQTEPEGVSFSVEDDGVGIPAGVIEQIFDPFFTTKDVGKGTGLGLSISYGIVRDHGGEIRVESTPGVGSRFRVLLPRDRRAPETDSRAGE